MMPPRNAPRGRASKSCASCRAVKQRCDLQRPHCGQCMRKGKECPGYRDEWELIFRDQTNQTIKQVKQVKQQKVRAANRAPSSSTCSQTNPKLQYLGRRRPSPVSSGPVMRNQVFSSYLNSYFPCSIEGASKIDTLQFILSGISALPGKNMMLEKALTALSCIFLGRINSDNQLLQYGLQIYNHAIQYMVNFIGRNAYTDDIIYTCVIFQQIQTHYCPSSMGEWLAHVDGLATIMKYYHPKLFTTPILAVIYGQYRKMKTILTGFTYISEETLAWLKHEHENCGEDGVLHEMFRHMTEISRVAAAIDNTDVSDHDALESLLNDSIALEKNHKDIYKQIVQDKGEDLPTYAPEELKTGVPATDDIFGSAYRFSSIDEALLHMFFWLSLSFVYPLIVQCQHLTKTDMPYYSETEAYRLSAFSAGQAARCLPYCGQEGMNSWSVYYGALCAVQVSRIHSHSHSRDRERFLWAQDVFTYMESMGFEYIARLRDIWSAYWSDSRRHHFYRTVDYRKLTKYKGFLYTGAETTDVQQNS